MITIREATQDDASIISQLMIPVAQSQIALEFPAEGQRELLSGMTPEAIERSLQQGYRYFLGFDGQRLIGVIGMRGYSHVYHLFVAEDMQGHGIARQLWQTADQTSRAEVHISRYTVFSSRIAEGFYYGLGFRRAGDEMSRRGVTAIPMCLDLNELEH